MADDLTREASAPLDIGKIQARLDRGYVAKGKGQAISDVYDLLAEVRALRATQERLLRYADHASDCELLDTWTPQEKCTCGFTELRAALTAGSLEWGHLTII